MPNQARVLIVDDDLDMCWALENILQSESYRTMTATTGQEALELAQKEYFHVALIDTTLPDMDGVRLATLVRETLPGIAIIMSFGYVGDRDTIIEKGLEPDAYAGCITEPFDSAEVRSLVRAAVNAITLALMPENQRTT